jgi:small subunit ribosomal protein S2
MPGAMVVVDPAREANAVREARRMGVAVIGILDTDCDPASVDIVIPGNDDALKSVRLMIEQLVSSVEEGSANHRERVASMGSAEKRDEVFAPGDEPRPTRGQRLPEGMATRLSPGSKAAAVLDEGEEGSPAGSVAKYGDEEST